ITVRSLDEDLKRRLRKRAAENGRSVEQEVREILPAALNQEAAPARNLGSAIHKLFKPFGHTELDIPPREAMREFQHFDETLDDVRS
ncbi:MAG: Arc family DNA-binding protein, partial [Caldilineaceae bacterium SB0670_bin_27]|nr:Arc family DNA-binding protein [Caldilineaceae bacterium SB0670_bin_27]